MIYNLLLSGIIVKFKTDSTIKYNRPLAKITFYDTEPRVMALPNTLSEFITQWKRISGDEFSEKNFKIFYLDDFNDDITVSTPEDYEEALIIWESMKSTSLRGYQLQMKLVYTPTNHTVIKPLSPTDSFPKGSIESNPYFICKYPKYQINPTDFNNFSVKTSAKIKYFKTELRRLSLPKTLAEFFDLWKRASGHDFDIKECKLTYKDDENDNIIIRSEADYQEALLLYKNIRFLSQGDRDVLLMEMDYTPRPITINEKDSNNNAIKSNANPPNGILQLSKNPKNNPSNLPPRYVQNKNSQKMNHSNVQTVNAWSTNVNSAHHFFNKKSKASSTGGVDKRATQSNNNNSYS